MPMPATTSIRTSTHLEHHLLLHKTHTATHAAGNTATKSPTALHITPKPRTSAQPSASSCLPQLLTSRAYAATPTLARLEWLRLMKPRNSSSRRGSKCRMRL
jgi:hypothetical protein